jgi:hypothetical protein
MNLRQRLSPFSKALQIFLIAMSTLGPSNLANAQATNAQLSGKVADATGAAIPNATIEVDNTGTGFSRTVTSSANGEYVIPSLPTGTYRLKSVVAGFKTYAQSGIVLEDGQNARVDVVLQIGSTTETVQVEANGTQVDTSSASIRTEVDATQIAELPLNTRDTLQLITLVPGVGDATLPVAVVNQRNGPTFSVNGSRVNGSEVSLDGAILVTALYNRPANLPNPDSIGEFSLLTNSYGAEFGHASGGAFVAISKSGVNTFHGSVWEFLRNDALNSRNWFAPPPQAKPLLKQNQFGVAGGGPIVKDRAFFYATYEGLRIHQVTLENLPTITPAQRAGNFSSTTTQLHDPFNTTCAANGNGPGTGTTACNYTAANGYPGTNQIPMSEWDKVSVAFMQTYIPVPTLQSNGTYAYTAQVPDPTSGNQYTIRGDYHVTKHDQAYVRFFHVTGPPYASLLSSQYYESFSETNAGTTIRDTHTFTPNLIADFGYSDTNLTTKGTPEGVIVTAQQMGAQYATGGYNVSPDVTVSGVTSFGSANPWYENSALKQADAKLTWVKGKHLFQVGTTAFREAEEIDWTNTNSSGNPTFSGVETGLNWADYLIGKPISFGQYTPYYGNEHSVELGSYVQDTYKITQRLTLNLGLRYDAIFPWREINHDSASVVLTNPTYQSTRFPTAPPGLSFPGDPGIPQGTIFMDKSDFAPRLGFSYDVFGDGRTAVRGGYGIFFNPPGAITLANEIEAPPFEPELVFTPNTFTNPYGGTGYTDPFPYPYLNPGANPYFVYPAQYYAPDPNLKNAFTQQYNLNVQHDFPKDLMMQIGYVGSHGNRLWDGDQANSAPYSPGATAANAQSRRPFLPQYYGGITRIADIGFSNYNSLQVTGRKRLSSGFTMQLAYTFSKSLDSGSTADADGGTEQDPANPIAAEYARSDFNQKHLFRLNGVWTLPKFDNLGFAKYALGLWEISGIVNYSSGYPFSVTTGSAAPWLGAGRDIGNLRLNTTGVNPCAGCGTKDNWARIGYFTTTAYSSPLAAPAAYGTFGNSGRNSLTGPSYFDTDMSLAKNWSVLPRDKARLQCRADFFNLFNNVNFNTPTTSSSSSQFGRVISAQNARQIQLALRVSF